MSGALNSTSVANCTDTNAPTELSLITASFSFVFFFVIVLGNLLIVTAIARDPYGELKKPFISLVGNLALADLIVGLVVTPISFILHVKEGMNIAVGFLLLRALHLSYFISCTASLLNITAITVDRYIAIAFPLYYKATYLKRKTVRYCLLIWVFAFGLPFVYMKVGYIKYAFVFGNIAIIATMVFLFSSLYIIRKLAKRSKNQSTRNKIGPNTSSYSAGVEKRLTKVFTLVVSAYLVCYFPSCLMIYTMNFCTSCSCATIHWFRDMQFVLVLLNSCVNPFLYAWQMKAFRSAFRVLVCPVLKRRTFAMSYRLPSSEEKVPKNDKSEQTSEQDNPFNKAGVANMNIIELKLE